MKLTEETRMIRDTARDYATARLLPTAPERDQNATFEISPFQGMAELGLFAMTIPEDAGGVGAGPLALCLVLEELGAVCPSTALDLLSQVTAVEAVHQGNAGGDHAQMLEALAMGGSVATVALKGDVELSDRGTLKGEVDMIPLLCAADHVIVEAGGTEGGDLLLVDGKAPGVSIEDSGRPLGMRAAGLARLSLDGAEGTRLESAHVEALYRTMRLGLAAISSGIGRGALECARVYAGERSQFGRPLSSFGAIRQHLAEMILDLESSRLLVASAASLLEEGSPAVREVAMARLGAGAAAVRISDRAVQIHGGYGYVADYPAERFYRDAQVSRSILTTDDEERARIADDLI